MAIPFQLRALLFVGAAFSAMPSLAMAADTSPMTPTAGDRTVLNAPAQPAPAAAAPAASLALPPPAAVVQNNADAAAGFKDVPQNHWAYPALQQLQADGIVLGYPDGTFRGKRSITRYELAAITARAIKRVQDLLANASTANKVSADDIATLRKLIDDNTTQLAALQKNVAALQTQTDLNTAQLKRQQFHLYYFLRAPGTFTDRVEAYNTATGLALKPGTATTGPSVGGDAQTLPSGLSAGGTGYQVLRMVFNGAVDPKVSYAIRLEDRYYLDNAFGSGNSGGAFGTSSAFPTLNSSTSTFNGGYPNNSVLRINYAAVKYADPSGLYARVGRFAEQGGTIGLAYSDYFNGGEVGYAKGPIQGFVGYGFFKAANSNLQPTVPEVGLSSQSVFGRIGTTFGGTKGSAGFNYVDDIAWSGGSTTLVNPTTGLLKAYNTPLAVGSVDAGYTFSPLFGVNAEYLHRFGNSPVGGSWSGANALWAQGTAGKSAGKNGNSYLDFGYIYAGQNSTGPHTEIEGTTDYQQFFINNLNGYKLGYIGIHHYFATNAQIGLIFQGWGLNNSTLPVNYLTGTVETPGFIKNDKGQAIFLETRLAF
jgi:hypothetical protein